MSVFRPLHMLADRYRLDGQIAAGGMGEVWRATDLVLGRRVAVKLLRAEYVQHPDTLARFRAEARHAGSLSHPHIAQIYDYGEAGAGHPPFLVMELVDGPPLTRLLAAGPLEPARAMDLIAQTADGLAAAHAAGLVHRDVKPGNLLLTPADQVKITDFGIARAAGSAPVTRTGMLVGTPAYVAPERVTGAPATPASDLYSLGIVAYECLAGALPFDGTAMEVALAHQMRALPPLPAAVPAEAAALVAGLTAKDPAARPSSAGAVAVRAGRIRDALAGAAVTGPAPPSSGAAAWPRSPSPGAADARADTLVTPRATLRDIGPPGPPRPARRPMTRHRPRRGRTIALAVAAAAVVAALAGWALAGASGGTAARGLPALPPSTSPAPHTRPATAPATRMVQVNSAALAGHRARVVAQRLRGLGLRVRVEFTRTDDQPPGTVVSVQPDGRVPAGSSVVVTAALAPHGHGHGHDHGHGGDGGGEGHGGD